MAIFKIICNYFSFTGRINRAKYFWTVLMIGMVGFALYGIWPELGYLVYLLMGFTALFPSVKRFQDMNWSGWWAALTYIPGVNIPFNLLLLFKRGTSYTNQYGDDPLLKGDKTEPQIILRKQT
jgi:uncharacterized membrane protein YhaH (DUF805 family)